jgi:hypothetical protein
MYITYNNEELTWRPKSMQRIGNKRTKGQKKKKKKKGKALVASGRHGGGPPAWHRPYHTKRPVTVSRDVYIYS